MGKGENAGTKQFLLFLQCFQKGSSSRVSKTLDILVKVDLNNTNLVNLCSCSNFYFH